MDKEQNKLLFRWAQQEKEMDSLTMSKAELIEKLKASFNYAFVDFNNEALKKQMKETIRRGFNLQKKWESTEKDKWKHRKKSPESLARKKLRNTISRQVDRTFSKFVKEMTAEPESESEPEDYYICSDMTNEDSAEDEESDISDEDEQPRPNHSTQPCALMAALRNHSKDTSASEKRDTAAGVQENASTTKPRTKRPPAKRIRLYDFIGVETEPGVDKAVLASLIKAGTAIRDQLYKANPKSDAEKLDNKREWKVDIRGRAKLMLPGVRILVMIPRLSKEKMTKYKMKDLKD